MLPADHYAKEAQRLLDDDTLKYALDTIKAEALDALALADADDKTLILRLQQKVQAVNDIRSELSSAVLRTTTAHPNGSFA
jgi:hypothetical protein